MLKGNRIEDVSLSALSNGHGLNRQLFNMTDPSTTFLFWWRWLLAVVIGLIFFGISMVLAPSLILEAFSLLNYSTSDHISTFGAETVEYVSLIHAVLGSVMFGWGIALLFILLSPFRRGSKEGWRLVAISVAAWFFPDTVYSLWSGFWQNAILNLLLVLLFVVPLAATYRACHKTRA